MKYGYSASILMVMIMTSAQAEAPKLDKTKVQAAITGKHTKVFGVDNLFKNRNKETGEWYAVMAMAKKYVDQEGAGDAVLESAMALCERASMELINTLKSTYNTLFSKAERPQEADVARARADMQRAGAYVSELKETGNKLQGQRYYMRKQREDARDILVVLLLTLETTIEKMQRDFEKRLAQV